MAQYTEVHHHDSDAGEVAAGLSATMLMVIIGLVIAAAAGLFWWQPWAGPSRSETTIVQPAPTTDGPDTTIVNPPSNTTIVNPPSNTTPPSDPNGGR